MFFLGTLGKKFELAPLNYTDFRNLPTLSKIWEFVLEKYMVPKSGRRYVMEAVNTSWRNYKYRFKKNQFSKYDTDEQQLDPNKQEPSQAKVYKESRREGFQEGHTLPTMKSLNKILVGQQLAPSIGSVIMSQLQEANPEVNLVIPEFLSQIIPRDASSTLHNGQSSGVTVVGNVNQVINALSCCHCVKS
uniref:Uncharacterized protein n=1 Tax=Chenopodium quinoa TaxID=63459 RepID=A0A803N898_CHEQI